jgi:hypothetical protein
MRVVTEVMIVAGSALFCAGDGLEDCRRSTVRMSQIIAARSHATRRYRVPQTVLDVTEEQRQPRHAQGRVLDDFGRKAMARPFV